MLVVDTYLVDGDDLTVRLLHLLKARHEIPMHINNISSSVPVRRRASRARRHARARIIAIVASIETRDHVPKLGARLDVIERPKLHAENLRFGVGLRRHVTADDLVLVVLHTVAKTSSSSSSVARGLAIDRKPQNHDIQQPSNVVVVVVVVVVVTH